MKSDTRIGILKKLLIVLIFAVVALLSAFKLTPVTVDPDSHTHSVMQIDMEIESVLKLTAGAAGASAAISLLPDDQCTPIAQQMAELSKYFLAVLSALYLEEYLVTMMGYVSFAFLVPLGCLLMAGGLIAGKEKIKGFACKLFITALALYCVIPLSVKTSEMVYNNYEASIVETIDIANEISVADEEGSIVDRFMAWIENAAVTIVDYVTGLLGRFIEAVAVMLVTSCLIPVLVILFFSWMLKVLYKIDLTEPITVGIKTMDNGVRLLEGEKRE